MTPRSARKLHNRVKTFEHPKDNFYNRSKIGKNMNCRPVRTKRGRVRHWEVDATGNFFCTLDPDYTAPLRMQGKKHKYAMVQLMQGGTLRWFYVHRIMAFSWLGDQPHLLRRIVDHRNKVSTDNSIENLRWVTSTANNINKTCYGLVQENGKYIPRIAGFVHRRYATVDEALALNIREMLVESYVRFNCRFPDSGNEFPHYSIHLF